MGLLDTISNFSHIFLFQIIIHEYLYIFVPFCEVLGDFSVMVHRTTCNRVGYMIHTCPNHIARLVTYIQDFMCSHWERKIRNLSRMMQTWSYLWICSPNPPCPTPAHNILARRKFSWRKGYKGQMKEKKKEGKREGEIENVRKKERETFEPLDLSMPEVSFQSFQLQKAINYTSSA